jgi:predicted ATPase/DNA-binding SARP family transcriptional activator
VTIRLRLLREVSYDGVPIAGARPADLLASLALHPSGLADARLVETVWRDDRPAAPSKSLQVLVSRLRGTGGPELIERYDGGYRLGLAADAVDALLLLRLADTGRAALRRGDAQAALSATGAALELLPAAHDSSGEGALADLRQEAACLQGQLGRDNALALVACGKDDEALPHLVAAHERDPDDVDVLEVLLRSEAVLAGAPSALDRYETYRRDLADRMGVAPDPALQRVQRELLASDAPIRSGVRYAVDELLGRADDLAALRGLVRTGRLTTIWGPGGLGKTRIAHVLAQEATQPRVHFVELVGISSADDLVSEVGSALGVRHSVTGRRTLTAAQLADVRGRISQELDTVPTLLVLDNCEHVLDAAASLVAFLLATTRDLRVVTTSRSPLGIAAERVFLLSQLAAPDGAELFTRRARAVRPDAVLPFDVVDEIVDRLDGLPLAVELAAARVRTMSADEVRRALDDRFTLLRGRDRTAPARHQTLTAVIAWSWDLLSPDEQRALAWLSVFHDGFSASAAAEVLGGAGPDLVDALVDHSLLTVSERSGVTRYRMLETVREYGAKRLAESGDVGEARAAQLRWALVVADRARPHVFGSGQVEAMDLLTLEEGNLADVLRRCLAADDAPSAVRLLAALGALWSISGNHARFFALADVAEQVLTDWEPPPDLAQVTADALGLLVVHLGFLRPEGVHGLVGAMARLGVPEQPWTRVIHALFVVAEEPGDRVPAALALTADADPRVVLVAWQWAAILAENGGDIEAARRYCEAALAAIDESSTVWQVSIVHTQLAMLELNAGRHRLAAGHARSAVPLLERLHAHEDALSMRTTIALTAIIDGELDEAERVLAEAGEPSPADVTAGLVKLQVRAELLLARGEVQAALASYVDAVERLDGVRFAGVEASGLEPWIVVAVATALTAHVRFGTAPAHRRAARELAARGGRLVERLMTGPEAAVDYPVVGMAMAALGAFLLSTETTAEAAESGVRLLALARRFSYNRWFPVMSWEFLRELAERVAPGRLEIVSTEYGDRLGRELRDEVAGAVSRAAVTSSG